MNSSYKYKTKICKNWKKGVCKFKESCIYAHVSAYKTKKCREYFSNGLCKYGSECRFIHANIELETEPLELTKKLPIFMDLERRNIFY